MSTLNKLLVSKSSLALDYQHNKLLVSRSSLALDYQRTLLTNCWSADLALHWTINEPT